MEYDKWGHFSLSVCLFFGFARTPGAAQYFVSTVALVGSGTVRITITAPRFKPISVAKSTDADAALHTGNERMIVEGSHFTGKRKSQLPSLYLSTPTNVGRGCHNAETTGGGAARLADAFWSTAERKPLIASALWAAVTKFRAGRALFFLKS